MGRIDMFPELEEFIEENDLSVNSVKKSITTHLQALLEHFNKYFPEEKYDWIRSPFNVTTASHLSSDMEDALAELSASDRTLKTAFNVKTLAKFWISVEREYPQLSKAAMDVLTLFGSTYLFQAKAKAGVVLLDLTAAYDTVWHRGLHLKLLRTIPDRHMVNFIMEMLSNRSFILQTSDGQRSRLRRLRNGVPQGSVLSPMLFNIYIFDLPVTTSRRYGYADDLAIMLHQPTWKAVEEGLNQDMDVLAAYLRSWRLQLSTGKTVSAVFHLCNREARRELEISVENKPLEFQQAPKYLGVRLDRTLSYKQHLDEVRAKVTARVSLIRRLAGTT
ncbi:hypothetical protein NHX12_014972 [Muraenolepis orangiensis]|uniref:Reverse transcriptase domain-containing protein n=1 Tax=Muraenolepis orangiensis TaxID=630683 RepID=A0A9Q0DD51_9TELE|nr:hypothetical protein NHX12_014972 [Muraenolepis orangiensis]